MSVANLLLLRESSPGRPPSWRWDLAGALASPADREPYDAAVRTAGLIQDETRSGAPAAAICRAISRLGPIADAYAFWLNGSTERASVPPKPDDYTPMFGPLSPAALAAAELEALILANAPQDEISARTGLPVRAVAWYEKLWFDVRSRLDRPGWISTAVIGTLHQGTIGTLLPALIRAYGYYTKSARIVAAAVGGFDAAAAEAAAENPNTFFASDAMAAGSLKAALAVRLMPLTDRRTYARVVELHQESTRIAADSAAAAGTDDENKIRTAAAMLTAQVKFKYGQAPPKAPLRLSTPETETG